MPETCKQKFVDANGDVHEFTVWKYYGGQAEFAAEAAASAVAPEPVPRAPRNPLAAKAEPAKAE